MESEQSGRFLLGLVGAGVVLVVLGLLVDEPLRQAVVILGIMTAAPAALTAGWGRARPRSLDRRR